MIGYLQLDIIQLITDLELIRIWIFWHGQPGIEPTDDKTRFLVSELCLCRADDLLEQGQR